MLTQIITLYFSPGYYVTSNEITSCPTACHSQSEKADDMPTAVDTGTVDAHDCAADPNSQCRSARCIFMF